MNQALYAHMNNKRKMKKKKEFQQVLVPNEQALGVMSGTYRGQF
jgi:hypothetical protein